MLERYLRALFVLLIVRPIVFLLVGVQLRGKERLPRRGPAIVIANHNSHLDTAILLGLFPIRILPSVHPVAAADYWLRNPLLAWFALKVVGIIPIQRSRDAIAASADPLAAISESLSVGHIVIFYPEGTRGEPEKIGAFRSGIARLAERHPDVPIVPAFLHGTGKTLPRGEKLLIPFCCQIWIGDAVRWSGERRSFLSSLEGRIRELASQANLPPWE